MAFGNVEKAMRVGLSVSRGSQQGQSCEGWPAGDLAFRERLVGDLAITAFHQRVPKFVLGKCGLNENLTGAAFTSGSSSDLNDRLGHALSAAKIGAEQALIGINNSHQRQIRKVMSLGEHLCANQDVGAARSRVLKRCMHRTFSLCAVAVNSTDLSGGKSLVE